MISFRPKMFEESAESKAPKGFWLNFLIFILVFLIGALLESIIPSILATRELVTTLMESDTFVNGSLEQRMQESMQLTTEVMLGNNTIMISSLLCTVFATLTAIIYCRFIEKRSLGSMGFRARKAGKHYLQGVAGNKIFNANNIDLTGMSAAYNQSTDVLARWTGTGTSNSIPRAVYGDPNQNNRVSDRFVENGSYLRIKNISLSYTFPKQWLNALTIENARLTLSCENVATFTGYSGFDPEVDINGIDLSRYPISRTFNLGINFNF